MKFLFGLGVALALFGLGLAIGSFAIPGSYASKARLVQIVEKSQGADLFGEAGTAIGSPQKLVIEDPKAFTGAKTPEGAEIVDSAYLKAHGIYPLQMQTVEFVAGQARLGGFAALIVGGALAWWAKRKLDKRKLAPES